MSKFTKSITSALAILSLSFTGLSAAKADETPTLTFGEFMAGPAYQDYVAANVANSEFLKAQSGLTIETSATMNLAGSISYSSTMKIETDMENSRISMTNAGKTMNIVIIGNTAYSDLGTYSASFAPANKTKVFSRIGKTAGKSIKMKEIPSDVVSFAPANLVSDPSAVQNQFMQSMLADLGVDLKFTEMVKSVNPSDETLTDYRFSIGMDSAGGSVRVDMITTFDANSMLVKIESNMSGVSEGITMTFLNLVITTSVTPDVVIEAPSALIDETTIIRTSNQLIAESKSTAKAAAITKKAAELAKKAKKSVSATYLQAAAKSLKYTVTKLSNGVKLTSTVSGVKGSLCVTAYKGKTSTKNC
ncbi:MAG: hypothetical protein EB103_01980 [Actinobacteria bacterium]|nr:hypothetical protein [Actinomycetota bacterium]